MTDTENTRFYKDETKKDPELAESITNVANAFENSAFNTVRRAHSSMEGITKFLKPYVSGFLLKKEPEYLKAAVDKPKKPMAAIVGGAKVSTKIPIIPRYIVFSRGRNPDHRAHAQERLTI